jgi:hypothetical protein
MSFHRESGLIRFSFLLLSINQFYFMLGKSIFDPSFNSSYFLTSLSLSLTHACAHACTLHFSLLLCWGWEEWAGGQHPHFLCNLMVSKSKTFSHSVSLISIWVRTSWFVSLKSPMTLLYLFLVIHFPIASVPGINSTAKRIKLMITLSGNQRPIHFKICLFISPIQPVMRSSKMILMQGSYQSLL